MKSRIPAFEARIQAALAVQRDQFDALVQEANQAAERDDLATAAARLDQAALLDEDEFVKRGLRTRRQEIDRTVDLLLRQAQNHVSDGQLSLAKQTLRRAQTILPSRTDVGNAIDRIVGRERTYRAAILAASAAAEANNVSRASSQYGRAQAAHPEWAQRDKLADRIDDLKEEKTDPVKTSDPTPPETTPDLKRTPQADLLPEEVETTDDTPELDAALLAFEAWQASEADEDLLETARDHLVELAEVDFDTFERQGRELLDEINQIQGDTFETDSLREAIRSLFFGSDLQAAIQLLKQLRAAGGVGNAALHAFLGVGYLKSAALSQIPSEALDLRELGLRQFRFIGRLYPDFELPDSLVSPLIRELFLDSRP